MSTMSAASSSLEMSSAPHRPAAAARPGTGRRRWLWGLAGLALLSVTAVGGQSWLRQLTGGSAPAVVDYVVSPTVLRVSLSEDGELKPKEFKEVKCEVEGNPKIVWLIPESTAVKTGDKLVELETDQLQEKVVQSKNEVNRIENALKAAISERDVTRSDNETKLRKAEIDREIAILDLDSYLEGEYPKEHQRIEIDIKQTEIDVEQKTEDLRKSRDHLSKGYVSSGKIRELTFALEKTCMILDKLHQERAILEQYTKVKNEKQKRNELRRAEEELAREQKRAVSRMEQAEAKVTENENSLALNRQKLDRLSRMLEKGTLLAPCDGIVKYGSPNEEHYWGRRVAQGEQVNSGQTIVSLPDTSQMIVAVRIHEADRHKIREGLECEVKVPAVPGGLFRGKLSKIDKFANSQNSWINPELKEHSAEVTLETTELPVSPGDTAEVTVLVEDVADTLAVPVQCVYSRGTKHYVFKRQGRTVEPIEVALGRSNTTLVELKSGIAANDRVLMQVSDEELALLPSADSTKGESVAASGKTAGPVVSGG